MATEKRMIDANAFKGKLIRELNKTGKYTPYECGLDDAISYLDDAPTVDAVEVVRCKDCKHREDVLCPMESVEQYPWFATKNEGFCSYGERRTDASKA